MTDNQEASQPDERLEQVLADYLHSVEAGEPLDRQQLLHQHPDLAVDLQSFFRNRDAIERLAEPIQEQAPTIGLDAADTEAGGKRVRYFGDYELIEEIARGGMGVVYRARQVSLNRPVALKMILAGQLASEADVQRFHTEAEAAANLDHPNIVPIYEIGEHEDQHYFSMKLIEGTSLGDELRPLRDDPKKAAKLLATVARAVHHAHLRGILHRDLKPGNVLIDSDGQPHVTDFGLAKRVEGDSDLTVSGAILGTPAYMAPEQAQGKKDLTTAVDVYCLGAMLYQMLTGRPPFQADTPLALLMQVIEKDPEKPGSVYGNVNLDLETICLKCLEKEPGKRYESAAALAEDLDRWIRGEPISARPVGSVERTWRWCKRNPAVAMLSSAVAVVLVAGIIASSIFAAVAWREANVAKAANQQLESTNRELDETNRELGDRNRELDETNRELDDKTQRLTAALKDVSAQRDRAERQETLASKRLYSATIASAQREWNSGDPTWAWKYLESCRWDLRGWEHDYLYTLFNRNQTTLKGHTNDVWCVAFSPDGRRIVSGSGDKTLKVWDAATGEETLTLRGHTGYVGSVAFSPAGRRIVSASEDDTLKVWDATTGEEKLTLKGHTGHVNSVSFSPDGQQIVSGSFDKTLKVWDAKTGEETRTLKGHEYQVRSVAFSPDGRRIVSASEDRTLKLWDAATGEETRTLKGHKHQVRSVAFSPDGQQIVSASFDKTLKVWDAKTGEETLTLNGHTGWVNSVAFSPDGRRIVSASDDKTLKVWDAKTGAETLTLKGHTGSVHGVTFSPDGRRIVSASDDDAIKLWDANTSQETFTLEGRTGGVAGGLFSVAFSPDGQRIVSGGNDATVRAWDANTIQETFTLEGHTGVVLSVSFSPDGRRIVSASDDKTLKVWDAKTGEETLTLKGHRNSVFAVAFSPDGRRIVSGGWDDTLKVWDATTGEEKLTLKGHTGDVNSVAFSPDGRWIVSGGFDKTLKVWDAKTGEETRTLKGHEYQVRSVAFSPDGRRIVSASEDRTLKLWDAATGEEIITLKGHTSRVHSVAFSPDGRRIVSGGADNTLKVWDATTGEETLTLRGHTRNVFSVVFSPDGRRIVSGSLDGTLKVWDATKRAAETKAEPPSSTPTKPTKLPVSVQAHEGERELTVDLPDGVKIEFVLIPAGEFMMGSSEAERKIAMEQAKARNDGFEIGRIPSEGPQHKVKITKAFYLGKYEVTQAQWQAVMGNNPSQYKDPMNPVETVSWDETQPFLAKLNVAFEEKGMKFTLPTEAQWEYACRAGTTTAFSFGDNPAMFAQYGWSSGNADGKTHPVGQGKPNAWGLYDMHGNVREWCSDWHAFYAQSPLVDPVGPANGSFRVLRGGSWSTRPEYCRSAFRYSSQTDNRGSALGFRLALVLAGK